MPRPQHAQGRPATRVIPDDWNTTHGPVVEKGMRGLCALRSPVTVQEWDGAEMQTVPAAPYWTGGCRIQNLTVTTPAVVAVEDREFVADYLVVIPLDVDVSTGDLVDVLAQPEEVAGADAGLSGLVLQVEVVMHGTERFERDLLCTIVR